MTQPSWLRLLGMLAVVAPLGACSVDAPDVESQATDVNALKTRRVLLCQQGLSDRTLDWDKGLFALCEKVEQSGFELIHDGTYPAFGALNENGAYNALFKALDTNKDGRVNADDTPTQVSLVGFSWGGINVTDIANRLQHDSRISSSRRKVTGMVLLDPFQPLHLSAPITANVAHAWEYRQTRTDKGDCSIDASLGFGFHGLEPKAKSESSSCSVYDLDSFEKGVGHCDVPVRAKDAAVYNLLNLADYPAWDSHAADCPVD